MPGYHFLIQIPTSVRKDISKIPKPWQERVRVAIDLLYDNPHYGEKMLGKLNDVRKIRVWPYRILYTVEQKEKVIVILEVHHRGSVSYNS